MVVSSRRCSVVSGVGEQIVLQGCRRRRKNSRCLSFMYSLSGMASGSASLQVGSAAFVLPRRWRVRGRSLGAFRHVRARRGACAPAGRCTALTAVGGKRLRCRDSGVATPVPAASLRYARRAVAWRVRTAFFALEPSSHLPRLVHGGLPLPGIRTGDAQPAITAGLCRQPPKGAVQCCSGRPGPAALPRTSWGRSMPMKTILLLFFSPGARRDRVAAHQLVRPGR